MTVFLSTTVTYSQDNYEKFKVLSVNKDTVGQRNLLEQWARKNHQDPEFYTCYFNYYVQKSLSEVIMLDRNPGKEEALRMIDSTGQTAGYLYSQTTYDPKYLKLGFEIIDKGIEKFPDRLDMRFGKIYMLGEANHYDLFTDEIVKSIEYSNKNRNNWLWTTNTKVKEPKSFLLDNIQNYVNDLYNLGNEQAKNIRRIAEASLRVYPDHVVSLSNLAISYILENNYTKALEPLLRAEKQSPNDLIVLGNIAHVYTNLNDNQHAVKYYEKLLEFGDENAREFAAEQLKKLKN